ncbi:MAG TPA: DUF11 domain-containing protein, partial [Chloroflexi bacterium]|nr:DUF11 domain-containing protein [Chloroflexota bacterium]
AHSISTDPLFLDPASGDLHLQEDSPCISIAGASTLQDDFDDREQRPMGAGPDMGADEFLEPWVQLEPDRAGSQVSGRALTYTHMVTNVGIRTDTFIFTADSAHGWVMTASRPVTLTPGAMATVVFSLYIPQEAISGTVDVAVVTATSLYNPAVFDTALETTTVALTHTVLITPDRWAMIDSDPDNPVLVSFDHLLINTGNYTATFDLTGGGGDPGFPTVVDPPSATLGVLEAIPVYVEVTVPAIPTHVFLADTEIISAVSRLDPAVHDRARDTILVNIQPGVEMTPDREGIGLPDELLVYTHFVTNTGNYTDTFSFTAQSSLGWGVSAPPTLTLASGIRKTVHVTVPVPSFVLSGTVDVTTVTVSSGWLPTVTASVVDTTTVGRKVAVSVEGLLPDADGWCVPPGYPLAIPYMFSVRNDGNYTDTFDITAGSSAGMIITITVMSARAAPLQGMEAECESGSCPATLSRAVAEQVEAYRAAAPDGVMYAADTISVTLGPLDSVYLLVEVLMDPTRTENYQDTVIVTAVSRADPSVSASDSFTSEINFDAFADIEPDNEGTIFLEKAITYTHVVTYTGTVPENTINVSAVSSEGWTVVVTPTSLEMSQNETAQVWVRLEVPMDAVDEVDITTVRTETVHECLSWDTAVNTTTVRRPHVILVPDHDQIVIPGTTVLFQHTLINDGVYTDSYDLSTALVYSSGVGWASSVAPTEVLTLPPGGSAPVAATVIVPPGLISGTKATLTVTASSKTYDPSLVFADAVDKMTVPYLPDAALSLGRSGQLGPDGTARTEPGGVVTYTHSLTNTGNYTLSFDLTTHPKFSNAEIVAPASMVVSELGMGGVYTPVMVRVEIPEHAAAGEVEETEVIAAFAGGQAVAVDYTTVEPITGTRYVAPAGRDDNNNCRVPLDYGPCATVQHAVDVAQPGDTILVAAGLYDDLTSVEAGTEAYTQVVYLDKDVTLLGGYTPTNWETFDPVVNQTVLDAGGRGRAMYVADRVTVTIAGFDLRNGQVDGDGAGLYIAGTSRVTVTDNTFHDNQAAGSGSRGGGLFYGGGDSPLERNTFHDNTAADGAGLYIADGSPTVWNSLFYGNAAGEEGGGLYIAGGSPTAWNNTFYSNTASQGGGIYILGGSVSISNTILAGNTGYGVYLAGGAATLDYNDWWSNTPADYSGVAGGGNDIALDPLFAAPASGNLHLTKYSPCVDAADPATTVGDDRDGSARPLLGGYDVGAYEYGLAFAKRVTPTAPIPPGGVVTYTIVVTNGGTGRTDVFITDTLHAFLSCAGGQVMGNENWVSASWQYQSNPCRLTWDGRVEASSTALVTFTAYITDWLAAGTVITNLGWVNSDATNQVTTTVASAPGPRYVATTGEDAPYNGCLSPRHPCRTVQRAADQAWDDDPVHVALGIYTGAGTVVSITHKSLALTGGYTPTRPLWTYDPEAYTTTLDGQASATVVHIVGSGVETVTLTGFHVQNGVDGVAADGAVLGVHHSWIHGHSGDGLRVTDGALELTRAWVYGNGGAGVDLSGSLYRLDNVILADNSGGGVQASGDSGGWLRHNTLVNNGPFGASIAGTAYLTNTIVCSQTVGVAGSSAVSVNDTLWYGNGAKTSGGVSIGGADLEADPVFVDPAGTDYHIAPGSGALDAGSDAGLREDIDAEPRPMGQGYDLGADELRISVRVSKQVAPDPVDAGGVVHYTIHVTNTGVYTLHTTVVDELPTQLTTVETTTWTPPALGPDDVWSAAFAADVAWGYSGTLTNVVRVTSLEGAADAFTATSRSQVMPGLEVAKWGSPAVVEAGERLIYTIRLTNTGNLDLHATVVDTLPGQVSPSGPLTWTPTLAAPGGWWEVSFPVTVAWGYSGTLVNEVQVTTAEGAMGSGVELSQARVTPAVAVVKWPDPDPVRDGEAVTYTIRVTNIGNVGLSATITDSLPACVTTTDPLVWTADLPAPNSVWEGSFTGLVEAGCAVPVVNVVEVTTLEGASDVYTHTSIIGCPAPLTDVGIEGSSQGYTDTLYSFTALITPTDATPPITYTWSPEPDTGQGTESAQYQWSAPGVYTITLEVENCGGRLVTTHTITIRALPQDCPAPLAGVDIAGPTEGYTDTLYTFTALITPTDATLPITYTWSPAPHSGQGTESAQYQWAISGTYTIMLEAENCGGSLVTTHTIAIWGVPPDCPRPLAGVRISGPTGGHINTDLAFTAIPDPLNANEPITYTWSPEPVSGQGTAEAVYRWVEPDRYVIAVMAENCGWWPVSDDHAVLVEPFRVYLPLVSRNW